MRTITIVCAGSVLPDVLSFLSIKSKMKKHMGSQIEFRGRDSELLRSIQSGDIVWSQSPELTGKYWSKCENLVILAAKRLVGRNGGRRWLNL